MTRMSTVKSTVKTLRKERPLGPQDRQWHLPNDQSAGKPHASGTIIRINSTYLELVDGNYGGRGGVSAISMYGILLCIAVILAILYSVIFQHYLNDNWDHRNESYMLICLSIPFLTSILLSAWMISSNRKSGEWFGYTHYPIRLNRKNRMVYVFRGDGTVLEAEWDKIYFTLYVAKQVAGTRWLGICGLVLKDPKTVEERFTFGFTEVSAKDCHRHWEFIRRYMEDGPQAVMDADGTTYCLPIADKKETPYRGWTELITYIAGPTTILQVLIAPILFLFWLGRLFANATCKVPLWPADVEAACLIDANDPYVRDSRNNPEGYR